jgi:plasmid maintenance system antidote protein VapI
VEILIEQIAYRKQQEKGVTQTGIARWAGMSPSLLSRILNGHTAFTDEHKQKLFPVLFEHTAQPLQRRVNQEY